MENKRFKFVKCVSSLVALFSFCAVSVTAQSLECGSQSAPPPNGNNPDSLILDRFGNVYDLEDLLVPPPTNSPSSGGCASGYFNLTFNADFPMDMRPTVCKVFTDLSETIVQHSNTLDCGDVLPPGTVDIDVVWKEITPSVILGTGTPFSTDITDLTFCPDMILDRPFIKINGGTVNTVGVFDGRLEINSNPKTGTGLSLPWHIDWTTAVNVGEIDLYSVALHEALHILGFASRITLPEYSLWDRIIHATDNFVPNGGSANVLPLISTHPLSLPCTPPVTRNCWHLANGINSGNLQTTVSNTCSTNNTTPDVVVGESAISAIDAKNAGGVSAQLSHLSETCNGSSDVYVMRGGFDPGMARRVISGDELSILCELGYEISTAGFSCQGCYNIANFEPHDNTACCYRVYHCCAGQPIEILAADLLCNDVTNGGPQEIVGVWHTNSSVQIVPNPAGNGWLITLGANHAPRIGYTVVGCDCRMHNARFNILLEKECPPCAYDGDACGNLLCFSDFEDYTNTGGIETWLGYPFLIEGNIRVGSPDISVSNGNHYLYMGAGGGFSNSKEPVVMELNECVPPGCALTLNADLGRNVNTLPATLNIWGSAQPPCPATVTPVIPVADNCGEVTLCGPGHSFAPTCVGALPVEIFSNFSFQPINHVTHTWKNLTNEAVCYLTLVPTDGSVSLDNLSATLSCEPEITCDADVPLGVCQGNSFPLAITICTAEIPGTDQTLITPNIDLPAGWNITSGSLVPFVLTEAQQCSTIHLQVLAPANAPIGSVHNILLSGTAIGICTPVEWSCPVSVTVIGCNGTDGFSCPCTDAGQINVDATSSSALYDPNIEGILWSEYAQANNLPDILDGSSHHGCIAVAGRLIVDRDLEIISCGDLRMQPCAEILVGTGQATNFFPTLDLSQNNIYGCERMWHGITIQHNCQLIATKNIISDAQFAVTPIASSLAPLAWLATRFYANTNRFVRNHVGVFIPSGNIFTSVWHAPFVNNRFVGSEAGKTLLPPCDPGLPNYDSQMGYAGLVTLGTTFDVGTPGTSGFSNAFLNIRNGVIAENNAWVNVFRANFDNVPGYQGFPGIPNFNSSSGIGVLLSGGISSVQNSRFNNVGHGVYSQNAFSIAVLDNQMPDVFTGIKAEMPVLFSLSRNEDIDFRDYGIQVRNPVQFPPFFNGGFQIQGNHLNSIEADDDGNLETGISIQGAKNFGLNADALIEGNVIMLSDHLEGIRLGNSNNCRLEGNIITIAPHLLNIPHTGTTGITLNHASHNVLFGNSVTNTSADPLDSHFGFFTATSSENFFCDNSAIKTSIGDWFEGNCDNTTLRTMNMEDNGQFALFCLPGTVIGLQPDLFMHPGDNHSNSFSSGSWAVHSGNLTQIQNSEFSVLTGVPKDHPDVVWLPNVPGGYDPLNPKWFKVSGFDLKPCTPPEMEGPPRRDERLNETDEYFATGGFLGSPYGDALNWEGQLRLYQRIQQYELGAQSAAVDAFYANASSGTIGAYAVVDAAIGALPVLPVSWETSIQTAQTALFDAVTDANNTLLALATVSTWEDSVAVYRTAEQAKLAGLPAYQMLMQYKHLADSLRSTKAMAAWTLNQALPANDILQSNKKTANRVYLETVAHGISALTEAQFSAIATIAYQCPLEGGAAVYQARGLYELQEKGSFDDVLLCNLSMTERNQRQGTAHTADGLSIQPNPASGQVFVSISNNIANEGLSVVLADLNGKRMLATRIPEGASSATLDVSTLATGIYICRVKGRTKAYAPTKIVVQH